MLYQRWQQVLSGRRHELAVADLVTGASYTFGQLDELSCKRSEDSHVMVYSPERPAAFILSVLTAWRENRGICVIEASAPQPEINGFPPGAVHLKVTSASSGRAKMVAFTAQQLMADADNIVATMGLKFPNLGVVSLAHSYGFSNLALPLLLHGIPLYLAGPFPDALMKAAQTIGDQQNLTLPAVPALWRTWREAGAIPRNVQLAISAGAPLSMQLEENIFERHRLKIHNFYGATECGGIAYDATDEPRTDPACVGRAMRNVKLTQAPDGCLEVHGEAVGLSYWPEPDEALGAGRFKTSDLVEFKDGLVFLRGRCGDQINIAGRKVVPEEVERAILADARVRECVVFGLPSSVAERCEVVVACISVKPGASADSVRDAAARRLPAWQMPRQWVVLDALPVNARGKLSRQELRKHLEGKSLPGVFATQG